MHWLLPAGNFKAEDLPFASDVCLQEVKFVMNPVLPLCHFLSFLDRGPQWPSG